MYPSQDVMERRQAVVELQRRYTEFHKVVHKTIAKVTGKKEIPDTPPEADLNSEALFDRLAAAQEVKKLEIIGTDEHPQQMSVGHTESHLKILKVDPNFMDDYDRKRIEEEYNKQFVHKSGWRKSFMNALNGGQLKSVSVYSPAVEGFKRTRRRNAVIGRSKRDFNPRLVWHMAIYKVIYGIRAAKENLMIDTVSDKSLLSQLHEFQTRADSVTLAKIEAALDMPSSVRTDEDLRFLNRVMMTRVRHFSKFTPEQRIQLCRVMTFEKHRAGSTIIKQGHPPMNFYFLFSGQCDVVKNRTDGHEGHVRVHVVNSGESFGAVALEGLVQETRTASVICTTESVFLVIDKDEYRRIASGQDSLDQLALRISFLKTMNIFVDCEPNIVEQVALKTRLTFHEQGSIILKEGQVSSRIYFLAKGTVSVSKYVPIIKTKDKSKYTGYDPSIPLQKNQIVSNFQVSYASCRNGEHFPEPDDPYLYDMKDDLNIKHKLQNRLTFLEPRCLNTCFATYECKTPVVCIDIHSLELAKLVPSAMVQKLLIDSKKLRVTTEDLTKHFILRHEWEVYRKKMISNYKSK